MDPVAATTLPIPGLLLAGSSADAASGAPIASASFFHLSRREEEE